MTIYEHRTVLTVSTGSNSTTTLRVVGGLARQLLIRSNTSAATVFRAQLEDPNGLVRMYYDYHTEEINDTKLALPMVGNWVIRLTNVSATDTFSILLAVQE